MSWRRRPVRLPQDLPSSLEPVLAEDGTLEVPDELLEQLRQAVAGNRGGPAQVAPILWSPDLLKLPEITVKRGGVQYPDTVASGGWCAPEVDYDHLL